MFLSVLTTQQKFHLTAKGLKMSGLDNVRKYPASEMASIIPRKISVSPFFRVKPRQSRPEPVPYMDHPGTSAHSNRRHDEQERHNALGNSKPS